MTIIKTLKDGREFSISGRDYTLGGATGLKGSAPVALPAPIGEWTHKVTLWVSDTAIGLTAAEASTVVASFGAAAKQDAAAKAQYDANAAHYQRFQSAADRRDRAYTATHDSDGEG